MSPVPSTSYWSIFERNLVGFADFAGSNSNGWPIGPVSIKESKLVKLYDTGGLFHAIHPVSIKKIETGPVASWPSVGTSSLQNRPIPLDSSRKLTNSSLRQQGTFFNVPCCLNKQLVNFRDKSCGIGRFRRLAVPTDG